MKLFLIVYRAWGSHHAVVRARDEAQARSLFLANDAYRVFELESEGSPEILWQYEDSPDGPGDA